MFDFMKKDPVKKAKKHIEKALREIEEDYPDYASVEYEKAAKLFLEVEHVEFAVKYFREAAYTALEADDHIRASEMKTEAAEALLFDGNFGDAGGLYSEASDHLFREKKSRESLRAIGMAVLCNLAARSFDLSVNLMRKAEKRNGGSKGPRVPLYDLAKISVGTLCEGEEHTVTELEKITNAVKPKACERPLVEFLAASVRLAIETEVLIDWAGPTQEEVQVKRPIEMELRYSCPVPVRVIDVRFALSNSLTFSKEPQIAGGEAREESWLFELNPVLSGGGTVGPFKVTLEGDQVLVHKLSNTVDFRISRAPAELTLDLAPARVSCNLGEEAILDVALRNQGEGPADNIRILISLSEGLELSMGGNEKIVEFLGSSDGIMFQIFVRGISLGEEIITLSVTDSTGGEEIVKSSRIDVG
ncbi:MAG: hypothetical protein JSW61_03715 [Candidatus Thorarchaeota archaeon]|nr:MAG: hypothetical protein JSW61_03715 [Candidatus Thorarchaeota archaeon]